MKGHGEILPFIVERSPERIVVYGGSGNVIFTNSSARHFLAQNRLPDEVTSLIQRLLTAIALGSTATQLPGRICFSKEIGERRLSFRIEYRKDDPPLVCVYFLDDAISGHVDLNALRQQFRLTRRELDALRHLLDGLDNRSISEELGITEQTVKEYVSSVYRKIGVQDRFSLLRQLLGPPAPAK